MIKITTLILSLVTFLNAVGATETELNSIYQEAILFVTVFGVMGIISFIYSRRHAKAYVPKKIVVELTSYQLACKKRLEELNKMLEDEVITTDEFELLEEYYKV